MADRHPRRLSTLLALYAAPAALWLAFARWAVPPVIDAAYHGRSLERLNRFFRGRQPHPVEHYFRLWDDFAAAVLIAGALHLVFVLLVRADEQARARRRLIGFAAAFLAVTLLSGPRHDYVADLEIWGVVLRGGDPWWLQPDSGVPLHSYGPLFNALAIPAALNPMAPKLLFAFAYLVTIFWLVKPHGWLWFRGRNHSHPRVRGNPCPITWCRRDRLVAQPVCLGRDRVLRALGHPRRRRLRDGRS